MMCPSACEWSDSVTVCVCVLYQGTDRSEGDKEVKKKRKGIRRK